MMLKKSSFKTIIAGLAVVLSACLVFGFQNCSQAVFKSGTSDGSSLSGDGASSIFSAVSSFQPALAVRSPNCINCHGNTLNSNLITDFGYGDSYFFSRDNASPVSGDWVYSLRLDGSFTPEWAQAQQYTAGTSIIVPKASLGFSYASLAPSGTTIASWMNQTTLASLLTAIGQIPGAESTPVTETSLVYIGAPTPAQLRAVGKISATTPQSFFMNDATSPTLSGLTQSGSLWTNSATVVCDGDVFLEGTVFLNNLSLQTNNGCRIHATGAIFLQKAVTYVNQTANSNLQLVSARAVALGLGNSHCEATTNPSGWYQANGIASPAAMRFQYMVDPANGQFKDIRTRNSNPSSAGDKTATSPLDEGKQLLAIAQGVPGLEDASCHGRGIAFEHLLMVAPQVHSRYTGNFTGVLIAEFPMLSPGNVSFTFDPLFKNVKVLPMIPAGQILVVK